MTTEQKITALENEIADYKRVFDDAKASGDIETQRLLLVTIAARRNILYLEKQGNQSAFSRGKRGIQSSSTFLVYLGQSSASLLSKSVFSCLFYTLSLTEEKKSLLEQKKRI
jgi:predicted nucleic acid-binding Zn finger protein